MGYFTYYINNIALDLILGGSTYTVPPTLYFGLSKEFANKFGSIDEPTGASYARVAVTNNMTNFPAALEGAKANGTAITWPTPGEDWGLITTVIIADALTGGNIMAMIDIVTPQNVVSGGSAPTIDVSALNFQNT